MSNKPRVLVLGGAGFIGRNFVQYLVENDLTSMIRVADKYTRETAWLTPLQREAFDKVEFVQTNLANQTTINKAFSGDVPFDYVFNCAGEARLGQTEKVYEERVRDLSIMAGRKAAEMKVKQFIEVSTAQVYSSDKKAATEDSKTQPWTIIAAMKLAAEQELRRIPGLNVVIVRPAIVYGVSDVLGIMPRVVIGAVYKVLGEQMKLLWTEKLLLNTVHVLDVARALWHVRDSTGEIYNLADHANSSQETISRIVDQIFGIKHAYVGLIMSSAAAKMNAESLCNEVNEKHMQPWSDICQRDSISNTPLTPYLHQELLMNNNLSVDGSKIEKEGFTYAHPEPTKELVKEMIQSFTDMNLFPRSVLA